VTEIEKSLHPVLQIVFISCL